MSFFWEREIETAERDKLRERQFSRIKELLSLVYEKNPFYRKKYTKAGLSPADINSLEDMAKLPFTTKGDFLEDQAKNPPYGTNLTEALSQYVRYHQTTGTTGKPLKWLDTKEGWLWRGKCAAMSLTAAGVTAKDTIFFPFAFGPHVAYWGIFEGAWQLGALAVAGGGWDTLQRVKFLLENEVTVVACTPTYALRMAEVAKENNLDLRKSKVRLTFHAGEPGALIPAVREKISSAWGARPFDYPGLTEVGAYGIHCTAQETAIHVNEAEFFFELVEPQTGKPVDGSGPGEMVLTNLGRLCSPAIRFRTGDIVRLAEEKCPCGRNFVLLEGGVIGRVDEMITIRGMNVFPSQVAAVVERYIGVEEAYQIVAYTERGMDNLKVLLEPTPERDPSAIVNMLKLKLRETLELRVEVEIVAPGTIARSDYKAKKLVDLRDRR